MGTTPKFDVVTLVFLTIFVIILSYSVIENYNAEIFVFDDTIYLSVVNNILSGAGFTANLVFSVYSVNLDNLTGHYNIDADSETIIKTYPNLKWEYGKPPLFFLSLASFFKLTNADPSNWVLFAGIFNTLITIIFIVFYYIFSKIHFGRGVAIISVILALTSFAILRNITTASPNQLVYLFILLSVFFLNKTNKHYILFGIFAALSSLTNQVGVLPIAAYSTFLICKREIKGFAIVLGTWLSIVAVWMVKQYQTFGDFGAGLGIPFSKEISSLFGGSVIHSSLPQSLKYDPLLPFEAYAKLWFNSPFNMMPLFLLSILAIITFFPIQNKRQLEKGKKLELIFISAVILLFLVCILLAELLIENTQLNIIVECQR